MELTQHDVVCDLVGLPQVRIPTRGGLLPVPVLRVCPMSVQVVLVKRRTVDYCRATTCMCMS